MGELGGVRQEVERLMVRDGSNHEMQMYVKHKYCPILAAPAGNLCINIDMVH